MERGKSTAALERAFDVLETIGGAHGGIDGGRLAAELGPTRWAKPSLCIAPDREKGESQ